MMLVLCYHSTTKINETHATVEGGWGRVMFLELFA